MARKSDLRRLHQVMSEVSEIDRVILMNRVNGRTNREIAEFLHCSTERVKKRYQRAARKLRNRKRP
jgi:RNA polymerase sigma factor (sigma-70 family)